MDKLFTELNFLLGRPEAAFDYPLQGWSYYNRATNLLREPARAEVGWGQWTKPGSDDNDQFNEVCALNPLGFLECDDNDNSSETNNNDPNCMGDYLQRESCDVWVCGDEDKGGIRGSIEGGMGYWPGYTIEKSQVTWQVPGATTANYEMFGGTMLGDQPQPCRNLGGAVRISNQLLVPNDFISFEGGPNVDGFLGYMLQATPIGKRASTDTSNYWTIIADSANFKGPLLYISTWFWDSRMNWHPKSVNWGSPDAKIGYVAVGFEGRLSAMVSNTTTDQNNKQYGMTTKWGMPLDNDGTHTTLFTGHAQYADGWMDSIVNDVMDGVNTNPDIKGAAESARTIVRCEGGLENLEDVRARLEYEEGDDENGVSFMLSDFGVTAIAATEEENNTLGCPVKYLLDKSKMDCETEPTVCVATNYFTFDGESKQPRDVPEDVKQRLAEDRRKVPPHRVDNRKVHGPPAGPEQECYDNPGPASPTMYCVRTATESWIGFKWYRFVDQPELTNVFQSLPEAERASVRAYMQARIVNLHKYAGKDQPWFDVPGGEETLPKEKVRIDEALLLTPPAGMEFGYVPIPLYQRKKERPIDCEVVVGAYAEEPEPLPSDYYENVPETNRARELFQCKAYGEDGYPGTVFPIPPNPTANRTLYQYIVPLPDITAQSTPVVPVNNLRVELDDSVPTHGGDTGGEEEEEESSPTTVPIPAPVSQPTPSPINPPVCPKNSKKVVYVNKKGKKKRCNWVKAGKTLKIRRKRCISKKYSYLGKRIKENCPKACGKYAGKGICKNLFLKKYK